MPILDADWAQDDARQHALFRAWTRTVAAALNAQLTAASDRFVAEPVCVSRAECAEQIERLGREPGFAAGAVPEPQFVASARFTERLGANVLDARHGRQTAGAVLFVGADNKADSDAALAFAVRAAALVSTGAGVVIVDALPGPPSWATHLHSLTGVYPIARRPRARTRRCWQFTRWCARGPNGTRWAITASHRGSRCPRCRCWCAVRRT